MKSFAIVLVCYNRLQGVKRLLNSLESVDYDNRDDIHLVFSIDYSGTNEIRAFAESYIWSYGEKHIRAFDSRQGLKNHILLCGDYTEQYDVVAILEDDLFVSDSFYRYAFSAASFYENDDNIAGISLYSFQKNWLDWPLRFEPQRYGENDTFFMKVAQSWGQVWTRTKWLPFKKWIENNRDFAIDNKDVPSYLLTWPDSSWLKYHDKYLIKTNKYFVYPYTSFSTNFSDAGEHSRFITADHQVELLYGKCEFHFPRFEEDSIRYDQYMEREGLEKWLGVEKGSVCVDFWGTKPATNQRYLLSLEAKPYKIVKSYQISLRPIELSVIRDIPGKGIYLYDTTKRMKKLRVKGKFNRYNYSVRTRESHKILWFALRLRAYDLSLRFKEKVKKMVKTRKR